MKYATEARNTHTIDFDGRLRRITPHGPRLVVPSVQRYELLRAYHVLPEYGHRSADILYSQLRKHYDWPGMARDCDLFVAACEPCNLRRQHGHLQREYGSNPEPPFPFHTICIDHKHAPRAAKGSEFKYILVVVCALTRFSIFIPVKTTTAEDTFRALSDKVFSVFSRPHKIVADNDSAFRNSLCTELQRFIGFRMVHVLGYSAYANGQAEQGVKRIGDLLIKHTQSYLRWDRALPMLAGALNTAPHTALPYGMSPFEAVFGRMPTGIA